ncbi:hypothetical protein J6590_073437 [Homalodisca vitripennis]|nr:hypothetical protein J6590_094085 [Homalodisca vitripennis]KAG8295724.1 hypothetical protein J6590_073437 [Homalodisca vitripennis]
MQRVVSGLHPDCHRPQKHDTDECLTHNELLHSQLTCSVLCEVGNLIVIVLRNMTLMNV